MVLSLIPRTLEALRTHFLAHYPAPDATQANAHCDPFGLLLKTREELANFAPSVVGGAGPPTNPAEGRSGIRNADAIKYAYVKFLMGCAIMLNDGCMKAALRYEDEVFVEGAEGAPMSLPHRFLVDPHPGANTGLNRLLAGDGGSINEFYAKMNGAWLDLETAAKALKWGEKIEGNALMAHRRLFSQKLGKSKGKQRLGSQSAYSVGHQMTGGSEHASSGRKRPRTESTLDADQAVAREVIAANPQAAAGGAIAAILQAAAGGVAAGGVAAGGAAAGGVSAGGAAAGGVAAANPQAMVPQEGGWAGLSPAALNSLVGENAATTFYNLQGQQTLATTSFNIPTEDDPFSLQGPPTSEDDLLTSIGLEEISFSDDTDGLAPWHAMFPEFVPGSSHDGNSGGFQL